ncbi:MAG: DNA repair protein RecO [Armatimonadota bacterium]
MPLYSASGIVLRRISFGETDRILTLYTRERGKISAIAKGARKPVSRLAGPTEVLTYARYQLATGRNLDIVTQADVRDSFPRVRADLSRLAHATYLAEIVDKMLEEHEANPRVFDLLLSSLYLLERENDPEKITRMFELQFMRLLGYEPALSECLRCRAEVPEEPYFSPSMGGVVCAECGPLPEDAISISRETLGTMTRLLSASPPEVEAMRIPRPVMDEMARVMRWYIRFRSERELKSADFLQTLRVNEP